MQFCDVHTRKCDGALSFALRGVDVSLANALRRALMSMVPTVAIERVRVHKNTGSVEDETIVHALGMVPLTSGRALEDESMLPLPYPGECTVCTGGEEGCEVCGVRLALDVSGPRDVTSDDLASDDPETVPFRGRHPISLFRLREGQEVHLVATAHRGRGAAHAKWTPVCPAHYTEEDDGTFRFVVETTGALTPKQCVASALRELELAAQRVQLISVAK